MGIGQGWARFVYGGSTGGWESLAVQMFYPDHYNGAFVACPDPVDFHAFMTADLYKQDNLFYLQGANKQVEQPAMRDYLGHTLTLCATTLRMKPHSVIAADRVISSIFGRQSIHPLPKQATRSQLR